MRLAAVACFLVALLAIVHGILLAPSYLYIKQQINLREDQLAAFAASAGKTEDKEVQGRLAVLETNAKRLIAQNERPTASAALRTVLAAPRTGIRITGFTYGPSANAEMRKMTVKGVAANREVLRSYVQVLDAIPSISTVELPISAYAKERDIEFMLTLTGTFLP